MTKTQNTDGLGEPAKGSREAYLLGRYPQTMNGWFEAALSFEGTNPSESWKWDFPFTAFADSINWWPGALVDDAHRMLKVLALLRAIDPGVLVEAHREWDELGAASGHIKRFLRSRDPHHINAGFWHYLSASRSLDELTPQLFSGYDRTLERWQRLGALLGRSLFCYVHGGKDHNFYLPKTECPLVITEFLELGKKLLPEDVLKAVVNLHDPEALINGLPKSHDPAGKMIAAILQMDAWVLNYLTAPVRVEPYLVFDDKNKTINFFKTEIAFDDLPTGGLELMRVFARFPRQPMSGEKLINLSGLNIDENQLPAYISRFRGALRDLLGETKGKSGFGSDLDPNWEKHLFIIPARKARTQAHSKNSYYELTLPADRVRYIAAI